MRIARWWLLGAALVLAQVGQVGFAASYTVQTGDTLYSIAKRHGVALEVVTKYNPEAQTGLRVGQTLTLPDKHTVATGDTLYRVALRYETTMQTLREINKLLADALKLGQVLLVPPALAKTTKPTPSPVLAAPQPPSVTSSAPGKMPSPQIAQPVAPTQPLTQNSIPAMPPTAPLPLLTPTPSSVDYTVQAGDTLSGLARKFGISVESIRSANNLETDTLVVGQRLRIVGGSTTTTNTTTGAPRNTLERVAFSYLGTPYVWGGDNRNGLDCSGFVMVVMQELGLQLPHSSRMQSEMGVPINPTDMRGGDLVFFNTTGKGVSHVGIYLGEGQFIHAATVPPKVTVSKLEEKYWAERFMFSRRVVAID